MNLELETLVALNQVQEGLQLRMLCMWTTLFYFQKQQQMMQKC